jgi:hypothetical protein
MPLDQGASFFVNPFTAYGLVEFAKETSAKGYYPKCCNGSGGQGLLASF